MSRMGLRIYDADGPGGRGAGHRVGHNCGTAGWSGGMRRPEASTAVGNEDFAASLGETATPKGAMPTGISCTISRVVVSIMASVLFRLKTT